MSGSADNLLYMTNPELAIALRRRKLGEHLVQQGGDASPIQSPWQGVNRLAQALIGGYELNKADTAVDDYAKKGQADFASALQRNNDMIGGGTSQGAPPSAPSMPQPGARAPAMGSSELMGMVAPAALERGIPLGVALAMFQQESGGKPGAVGDGGKSVGLGQIQDATARNPGYGVAPMDPAMRTDPQANINFSLDYLKGKGAAVGATDFSNPDHQALALRAYNGGGDPNYVQNVRAQMVGGHAPPQASPGQPATGAQAPQVQQAMRLMDEGQRNSMSFDPRLKALGQSQMQRAQFMMSLDTYQPTRGGQVNVRTGKIDYAPQPTNIDTGTEIITLDNTGQEIGRRPKNVAGVEAQKKVGEAAGTKVAEAPSAIVSADQMLDSIDGVLKHPGLRMGTGLTGTVLSKVPGTDAYDFAQRADQLKGQAFLQAFQTLKGGGQITEVEGKKATDAIARLNTAQSEDAYRTALGDLRGIVQAAKARAVGSSGGAAQASPVRVTSPEEASKLPSGTAILLPDGSTGRVP